MCHIFLCVYQVLHNKIKRLKIKRKRRHKGKPKSLSDGLLCSARLSPRGSLTGPQLSWPVLASLTQHSSGPEPALRFNRESDHPSAPRSTALSSSSSVGPSGRRPATVPVIWHTLPDFHCGLLLSDNHRGEYPAGPIVFRSQCNALNKASYHSLPPSPRDFTSHSPISVSTLEKHPFPFSTHASGWWGGDLSLNVITKPHLLCFLPLLPFWISQFCFRSTYNYFHQGLSSTSDPVISQLLNPTVIC